MSSRRIRRIFATFDSFIFAFKSALEKSNEYSSEEKRRKISPIDYDSRKNRFSLNCGQLLYMISQCKTAIVFDNMFIDLCTFEEKCSFRLLFNLEDLKKVAKSL